MEFTLLFAAATGFAAVWITNRLLRSRFPSWLDKPTDLLIGAAAIGMLIGRLASMISSGVNPVTNPGDILLVRGGVSTGFAVAGALAAVAWAMRDHLPAAFDLLAPAALAGLAGWHAGCVWRSSCLGTVTDLPWAMSLPDSTIGRHPVELYTAVALGVAAWLVARLPIRPLLPAGAALAAAGAIRLATQPFRVSVIGGPVGVYLAGIILGTIAVSASLAGIRFLQRESDAPTRTVLDEDRSPVGLDDAAGDGESQA